MFLPNSKLKEELAREAADLRAAYGDHVYIFVCMCVCVCQCVSVCLSVCLRVSVCVMYSSDSSYAS